MLDRDPEVVLRLGSHAEKEYFEKLAKSLDAVMFGGNLLEITPSATSSFLFSLKAKRGGRRIPFYLDPMTYCFGPYIDPKTDALRVDLDSLKSDRLIKRGSKKRRRAIKESYRRLAVGLGDEFESAINDGIKTSALRIDKLSDVQKDNLCLSVLNYQWKRVAEILSEDELMADYVDEARPEVLFAPYFFISPGWSDSGLAISVDLARRSASAERRLPVHTIFCGSASLLDDEGYIEQAASSLRESGVDGVWLWFDGMDEFKSSKERLKNLRLLVRRLSDMVSVFNLHGGYFNLLLAHDGLSGISHGVGYGERKPVAQVIGAAAPTVRYYLPPIKMRVGVPETQLAMQHLNITSTEDFVSRVCDCQICKGVLSKGIENLSAFGDVHKASAESKRDSQTPAAAKMCRYHFLLNRLREPKNVSLLDAGERIAHLQDIVDGWNSCVSLAKYMVDNAEDSYIDRWVYALGIEM